MAKTTKTKAHSCAKTKEKNEEKKLFARLEKMSVNGLMRFLEKNAGPGFKWPRE